MRVRYASGSDIPALVQLINAAFEVERFFIDRDRTDARMVAARLARDGFLIGEDDRGEMVACAHIEQRGNRGHFGLLAVRPERKGQGFGPALIAAIESHFRSGGCTAVDIRVVNLRTELPPFYRRLGYVEQGTEPFNDPRTLRPCHFICMTKPLVDVGAGFSPPDRTG